MYKVVRKLNEDILEDFGTFDNLKEAENKARLIRVFLGYTDIFILEEQKKED